MNLSSIHPSAEPVAWMAVVNTGLAVLLAFGVHLTTDQNVAIVAFVNALLGVFLRSQVTIAKP